MQVNGSELKISTSYEEADALLTAIMKALKGQKIDLEGVNADVLPTPKEGEKIDVSQIDLSKASGFIETIANLVLSTATSPEVKACLWTCAKRCVIGNEKVDKDFFEKVENRKFYFPIMVEIIKENCGPFFAGLGSLFSGLGLNPAKFLR
jgi:hypothetical protein